jgi:hypothetical protein
MFVSVAVCSTNDRFLLELVVVRQILFTALVKPQIPQLLTGILMVQVTIVFHRIDGISAILIERENGVVIRTN